MANLFLMKEVPKSFGDLVWGSDNAGNLKDLLDELNIKRIN